MNVLTQPGGRWWGGYDDGGGWPWVWGPVVLLLWLALTALVVWLVVRSARPKERSGAGRAQDVLAERYARGEISSEEYEERLTKLRQ
jgi:putative membrane protein